MSVSLPLSVWIPFFIGDYARMVGGATHRRDDYWPIFLAQPEVQQVPAWGVLWDWLCDMDSWMRTQCGWNCSRRIGGFCSHPWWAAFEETFTNNRDHPAAPHPHVYTHPEFGTPGTGYDCNERPYGMPELLDVNYTTFH